jgi:hypothetical protein
VVGADLRLYGSFLAALADTVFLAALAATTVLLAGALTLLPDTLTVAMMLIVCCVFGNNNEMKCEMKVCFVSCWCYFV